MTETTHDNAALTAALQRIAADKRTHTLANFTPYAPQERFLDLGALFKERALWGANRSGKTEVGAYEVAVHATGLYPDWWLGRRFDHPVRIWCAGESASVVMNVSQRKLCGDPADPTSLGTGFLPGDTILGKTLGHGVTNGFDTVAVRHVSGGVSSISFKSYEAGPTKFVGEDVHVVWVDEPPPAAVYAECVTRTVATNGLVFVTATPIRGADEITVKFDKMPRQQVRMSLWDVAVSKGGHIPDDQIEAIVAAWPEWQREARSKGLPTQGTGAIFNYPSEAYVVPPPQSVPHWHYKIVGIDPGLTHGFGVALLAHDRDTGVVTVLDAWKLTGANAATIASRILMSYGDVPVAYPQDAEKRDFKTLESLVKQLRDLGLRMLGKHSTHAKGSTEENLWLIKQGIESGQFKVASTCLELLEEMRSYHFDEKGQLVKVNDDCISAVRTAFADLRHAQQVPLGPGGRPRGGQVGGWAQDGRPRTAAAWDPLSGRPYADQPSPYASAPAAAPAQIFRSGYESQQRRTAPDWSPFDGRPD